MKRILIPTSFSKTSKNALLHAISLYEHLELTLLNAYPIQKYNRKYNFGNRRYDIGMRDKLRKFYHKQVEEFRARAFFAAYPGTISEIIRRISKNYDLMVMSRKEHESKEHGYFSDKKLFITTNAKCPVLIMPFTDTPFKFTNCNHIWHIKRKATESEIVERGMKNLEIDPEKMQVKSPQQSSFLSNFWQNIVSYEKSHDEKLLKKIDEAHDLEPIDLIILVDNEPSIFTSFFKSEVIHLFGKYDIPILVFPKR